MCKRKLTRMEEFIMEIKKITNDNFEQEILQSSQPVLVDFYADWCGHCRAVAPILDELAEEEKIQIAKLNTDENGELAAQYNIQTIPTLALFQGGKIQKKLIGGVEKEEIEAIIPQS